MPYIEHQLEPARPLALTELCETFIKYHPNLDKSDEYATKQAFRIINEMFPANEPPNITSFKPGYFIKFQKYLITLGYARSQVNRLVKVVKRVFLWGGNSRFDLDTYDKLPAIIDSAFIADMKSIKPVESTECHDNPIRTDIEAEYVEAVFPHVSNIVADILRIQLSTGMRPNEVCKMKVADIKRTKSEFADHSRLYDRENWIYVMKNHKTQKHIGEKIIPLGLAEQNILFSTLA
jgi:integrase